MIEQLSVIRTGCTDPRHNLAKEAVLLETARKNRMILYLWQNDNTVVIGRNQNIWKECNLKNTERDGVTIVRRPSGGGAVYHDLGNLNFTMIADDDNYDVAVQTEIIVRALRKLGIEAGISGRNDILVNDRKVSGNAYRHHHGFSCQHGTLLVNSDLEKMNLYLNPDPLKLQAKGVDSVRSRVMNLKEICVQSDIDVLCDLITECAEETYGLKAEDHFVIDPDLLKQEEERFASREWTFGKNPPFEQALETRFAWGGIRLEFSVREGRISDLSVWTDAMDENLADDLKQCLEGILYTRTAMCNALWQGSEEFRDIAEWIRNREE